MADVNKDITLLDTDAMRLAISDDREFKTSGGRYTNAGKARLNAIRLIEDEQDKGNRFIVSDGRYTLHNTEGEAMPFAGLDKEKGYKLKGWVNVDKRVDREASRIINSDAFIKADIEEVKEVKTPEDVKVDKEADPVVETIVKEKKEEKKVEKNSGYKNTIIQHQVAKNPGAPEAGKTGKTPAAGTGTEDGTPTQKEIDDAETPMLTALLTDGILSSESLPFVNKYVTELVGITSMSYNVGNVTPLSNTSVDADTATTLATLEKEIGTIKEARDGITKDTPIAEANTIMANLKDAEAYRSLLIYNQVDKMEYLANKALLTLKSDIKGLDVREQELIIAAVRKEYDRPFQSQKIITKDNLSYESYLGLIDNTPNKPVAYYPTSKLDNYSGWSYFNGLNHDYDSRYWTKGGMIGESQTPYFTNLEVNKAREVYNSATGNEIPIEQSTKNLLDKIKIDIPNNIKELVYDGHVPDIIGPRMKKALEMMDISKFKGLKPGQTEYVPHTVISTFKKGGELRELSKVRKFLTGGPYNPQNNTGQFHGPTGTYTPTGAHPVFKSTNTMTVLDALDALNGFGPGSGGYMTSDPSDPSDPNDKDYSKASIKNMLKLARSKFTIPQNNLLKPGLDGIRVGQTGLKLGYDNIIDSVGAYAAWKQKPAKEEAFHKTFVEGFVPTVRGAKEADTTFEEENINNISSGYKGSDIVKKERTSMVAAAQRNAALDKLAQARHTYARSEEARVATETGLRDQGIAKNRVELNNVANANRLAEHSTNKSNNLARMAFKAQNLANITEIGKNISLDLEESSTKNKRDTLNMDISRMSEEYNKMVLANTSGTPAGVALKGELDHARTMARYS